MIILIRRMKETNKKKINSKNQDCPVSRKNRKESFKFFFRESKCIDVSQLSGFYWRISYQ